MTIDEAIKKFKLDEQVGVRFYDGSRSLEALKILAREYLRGLEISKHSENMKQQRKGDKR
jgi:hypothetical protein